MVKRIIVLVVLTFSLLVPCFAIGDPGSQELRFIYITNTIDTPNGIFDQAFKAGVQGWDKLRVSNDILFVEHE
jgi:hypothetical protein